MAQGQHQGHQAIAQGPAAANAPAHLEHGVGLAELPGVDHAKPGTQRCCQGAATGGQEALLNHKHQQSRQEHGRNDLALFEGKGPAGPHIGLGQAGHQAWPEGLGAGARPTCPETGLEHQRPPARQARQQADHNGRGMGCRGGLERLRCNHDADVEHDRHPRFNRHHLAHQAKDAAEASHPHHHAVQPGVANAGPHGFPAWMADVKRGGKTGAQPSRGDGADAIDQ